MMSSLRANSPVLSNEVLATKLNQQLPVHVTSDDITDNPNTALLLEDLLQRLTHTGVVVDGQKHLTNSTAALRQARKSYMEQVTMLHYTRVLLRQSDTPKALQHAEDALSLSELAASLHITPTTADDGEDTDRPEAVNSGNSDVTLMSQTNALISTINEDSILVKKNTTNYYNTSKLSHHYGKMKNLSVQSEYLSYSDDSRVSNHDSTGSSSGSCSVADSRAAVISLALKNKPTSLQEPLQYHSSSDRVLTARAARLLGGSRVARLLALRLGATLVQTWLNFKMAVTPPHLEDSSDAALLQYLAGLSESIATTTRAQIRNHALTHALLMQVDGQLVEYGTRIVNLIDRRRLSQKSLHHLMYLSSTLHAEYHKLRCVETQALCSSYTPTAIGALRSLARKLSQRIEDAESEATALRHKLEPYKHLDPVYRALLDEYNKLKADLEFCKSVNASKAQTTGES